jgi:hypothetical protein
MNMEQWWNDDILAGETEVLGENLPSATLSTTNPTWIDPGVFKYCYRKLKLNLMVIEVWIHTCDLVR